MSVASSIFASATFAGALTLASPAFAATSNTYNLLQSYTAQTPAFAGNYGEYIDLNQSILGVGSLAPAGDQIDLFSQQKLFSYDFSQSTGQGGKSVAVGDFATLFTANTHTVNANPVAGEVFLRDTLTGADVTPTGAQNATDFGLVGGQARGFGQYAAADGTSFIVTENRDSSTAGLQTVIF